LVGLARVVVGVGVNVGVGVAVGVGVGAGVDVCDSVGLGVTELVSWHDIAGINKPISIATEIRFMKMFFMFSSSLICCSTKMLYGAHILVQEILRCNLNPMKKYFIPYMHHKPQSVLSLTYSVTCFTNCTLRYSDSQSNTGMVRNEVS